MNKMNIPEPLAEHTFPSAEDSPGLRICSVKCPTLSFPLSSEVRIIGFVIFLIK